MTAAEPLEIPPVYFKIHLKILFYLGIDIVPIENTKLRALFHVYTAFIIGAMCIFTITEFTDLVVNYEGMDKLTFGLCYLVTHLLGTAKMFLMIALRKKLWHLCQKLEQGVFKPNYARGGKEEFDLVNKAIRLCKMQGYCFYTFVIVIIGARAIFAASANIQSNLEGNVTQSKTMPYTTWTPFDYNNSPYYECVFAFQIASTVIYGYYIGATDALICGFMMLIKAQFLILKRALDTLLDRAQAGRTTENMELVDTRTQHFAQKLADECVKHHQELLAFCDEAEDNFCYLMLLQFFSTSLITCFQLYQLSRLIPGSVEFVSMLLYAILMVFQLLMYCWHGNEVGFVSGQVSWYVYNINWIVMKDSVKKTLLLITMRSQRANYFTAGKISLLSLETFMTIMRVAASYFVFLRKMNV